MRRRCCSRCKVTTPGRLTPARAPRERASPKSTALTMLCPMTPRRTPTPQQLAPIRQAQHRRRHHGAATGAVARLQYASERAQRAGVQPQPAECSLYVRGRGRNLGAVSTDHALDGDIAPLRQLVCDAVVIEPVSMVAI